MPQILPIFSKLFFSDRIKTKNRRSQNIPVDSESFFQKCNQ